MYLKASLTVFRQTKTNLRVFFSIIISGKMCIYVWEFYDTFHTNFTKEEMK